MQNIYQYLGLVLQDLATPHRDSWMKTPSKIGENKKNHRDKFNKESIQNWCSYITYFDIVKENQASSKLILNMASNPANVVQAKFPYYQA